MRLTTAVQEIAYPFEKARRQETKMHETGGCVVPGAQMLAILLHAGSPVCKLLAQYNHLMYECCPLPTSAVHAACSLGYH